MPDMKISVIIPTYNRSQLLIKAVQSVFNQTYQNFEIIIVDDASTDGTEEVVKTIMASDDRVRYFKQATNKRAPAARNRGLDMAMGEYIQFLDSDDLLVNKKFQDSINIVKTGADYDAIITQTQFFGDQNGLWGNLPNENRKNFFADYITGGLKWQTSGPLWKKSFLQKIGGFKEDLWASQEHELHIRALCYSSNYYFINEAYVKVRVDNNQYAMRDAFRQTRQRLSSFNAIWYNYKLLKDLKSLNPNIHNAFMIQFKHWLKLAVIEDNFYLINLIFQSLLKSRCSTFFKLKILMLGYPMLSIIKLTGKGKNLFLKSFI